MEVVPPIRKAKLEKELGRAGRRLTHLPFCSFKRMAKHKWGCLRLWPKWKSLKKIWSKPDDEGKMSWDQSMEEVEEVMKGVGGGRRSEE